MAFSSDFWLCMFWIIVVIAIVCVLTCLGATVHYCSTTHRRQIYRLRRFRHLNFRTGQSERFTGSLEEEYRPFAGRSASAIVAKCRTITFKKDSKSWRRRNCKNDVCSICIDDFRHQEKIVVCPCKHGYHRECLRRWLQEKNSCPMCYKEVAKVYAGETTWGIGAFQA